MEKFTTLKTVYLEIAFWCMTAAGAIGAGLAAVEGATGISTAVLIGLGVAQAVLAFIGGALLRKTNGS